MSCILRVSGTELNIKSQLKIKLVPDSTWERGTPVLSNKPDGKKHSNSGARYVVSEADFDEFQVQKSDAVEFMEQNNSELIKIMNLPGIEGGCLDFGIYYRDVPVQCDYFPPELVLLAGRLGLGIELSQYPPDEDDEDESEQLH
jgi:hypothetical protein